MIIGIVGLSGQGKTTLANLICKKHNFKKFEMDWFEHIALGNVKPNNLEMKLVEEFLKKYKINHKMNYDTKKIKECISSFIKYLKNKNN